MVNYVLFSELVGLAADRKGGREGRSRDFTSSIELSKLSQEFLGIIGAVFEFDGLNELGLDNDGKVESLLLTIVLNNEVVDNVDDVQVVVLVVGLLHEGHVLHVTLTVF